MASEPKLGLPALRQQDADVRGGRIHAAAREFRGNLRDLGAHLALHWRLVVGLAGAGLIGALVFAWSGLYSVGASSGHYPFFRAFLGYALRQSVATHSAGIVVPDNLAEPRLIRLGAAHFQGGCAPCHGAPGEARNPIARRMLPEPPGLADRVAAWQPAELFWIVRNGIKYAGMPAWVAQEREDEVWAVVAFLRKLPDLDEAAYRRLAFGDVARLELGTPEAIRHLLAYGPPGGGVAACSRCHGEDGSEDGGGAFPRLQGQSTAYLRDALQAYALGTRPSGIMQPVAASLEPAEIDALARHYGDRAPAAPAAPVAPGPIPGERIAREGIPARRVAACIGCHGPGMPAGSPYQRLAGQSAAYIAGQLRAWSAGQRGTRHQDPRARIMAAAIGIDPEKPPARPSDWPLGEPDIAAVAAWYAAQPAEGPTPP